MLMPLRSADQEHLIEKAQVSLLWRHKALAAVQMFMMHAASGNGFSVSEGLGLFPRRFNRSLLLDDMYDAPWLMQIKGDCSGNKDDISEPLMAGAGAGLVMMRRSIIDETRMAPSPLPDGGLFLLAAAPADFLQPPGVRLLNAPTFFGAVNFSIVANQTHVNAVLSRPRSANNALQPKPAAVFFRCVAGSDEAVGISIPQGAVGLPPASLFDTWTLRFDTSAYDFQRPLQFSAQLRMKTTLKLDDEPASRLAGGGWRFSGRRR